MAVAAVIDTPDLGASLHRFLNAAQAFFTSIADIAWGYLAAALLLSLALQLCSGARLGERAPRRLSEVTGLGERHRRRRSWSARA